MRRLLCAFALGAIVGGTGVGGILIAAGDPYEYATLRDYPCEQIKTGQRPPPAAMVPGQDNPCFIRYARWSGWLQD